MVHNWNHLIGSRKWQLKVHPFFTTPWEFYKMKRVCPDLYNDLSQSDLLIFKGMFILMKAINLFVDKLEFANIYLSLSQTGDLNYVKLLGNLMWPSETPFHLALQDFKPTNLISLRAAKYNLMVNLKDERILADLPEQWYANGDYAAISMYRKS